MVDEVDIGKDPTRIAALDPAAAYASLGTGPAGLTSDEARRRLETHGPNVLPAERKAGVAAKVARQFRNLFNVLLLLASGLSFLVGVAFADPSSLQMGWAILGVVLFNTAFSVGQEFRAERTVEALRRLIPANVRVVRDGGLREVPAAHLVPGDVIGVEQGERVPADARLVTAFGIAVDHASLTGEAEPLPRMADAQVVREGAVPTDLANLIFAGTTVASGSGTAVVVSTGTRTRFGEIVARTQAVREEASPLQRALDRYARTNFVIAVAGGVVFLALALLARGVQPLLALLFMIGVIISLVPEGLQLTVTLSLAFSSLSMARAKVVTKRLASVETLGSTTVICTDKTGTVTTGQMTVRGAWIAGVAYEVTGEGFEPEGVVARDGRPVQVDGSPTLCRAAEIAALNNQSSLVPPLDRLGRRWTAVGDTTEAALLAFAVKAGIDLKRLALDRPRVGLVPFDSGRKMMTSVHRTPEGVFAFTKGAAREVLARCTARLTHSGEEPLGPEAVREVEVRVDAFAREAFRVLALAYRPLRDVPPEPASIERELVFVGVVAIQDPPRPEAAQAVRTARNAGVRVFMLTGDHELTAAAIARQVGLLTPGAQPVITGARLTAMTDPELAAAVAAPEAVFARITPEQKHRVVQALKAQGEVVAVTGDGVNDAPALAEADIGIAMGITGTDVAREAADMILVDDNFASIVRGVEIGRGVFDNLRRFITYVFTHNWAELMSFVAFVLVGVPLAITVLYVLAIDLVMEVPISLALTLEPPGPHVMGRPPRPYGTPLYDRAAVLVSTYLGVVVGIAALLAAFTVWSEGGWSLGMGEVPDAAAYPRGSTLAVAGILLGQVGNFFARRADPESAFRLSPLRNRWLVPGVAATLALLLLVVYAPPLQALFGTAPLRLTDWLLVLPFAPLGLALEEIRMAAWRRIAPAPPAPRPVAPPEAAVSAAVLSAGKRAQKVPRWATHPIVLPLFLKPGDRAAILVALRIAGAAGSRVVVVPLHRGADPRRLAEREQAIERIAIAARIPVEYVRLARSEMPARPREVARAIAEVANRQAAGLVVLATEREPLSRLPLGPVAPHLARLTNVRIVLARSPREVARWPTFDRILIPVLREFHAEPFEVADLLTTGQAVPDVGVLVARVIRIPPIVPLYATYTPESLVDPEREASVLRRRLRGRDGGGEPRILLVRDIARDLRDWASERDVDAIVMWGDRREPLGVSSEETGLVREPLCSVLVVLPGVEEEPAE